MKILGRLLKRFRYKEPPWGFVSLAEPSVDPPADPNLYDWKMSPQRAPLPPVTCEACLDCGVVLVQATPYEHPKPQFCICESGLNMARGCAASLIDAIHSKVLEGVDPEGLITEPVREVLKKLLDAPAITNPIDTGEGIR